MKRTIFVLGILIACGGCVNSGSQVESDSIKTITIESKGELKKTFSQFIDSIRFIPLETSSEVLIGRISEIQIHNDIIYIKGKRSENCLFVFDTTGTFLFKINQTGKGPGEFVSLSGFYINQEQEIVISDSSGKKILFYSPEGVFINEIATTCYPKDVVGLGNNLYAIARYYPCSRISIINLNGEIIRGEIDKHPEIHHAYNNQLVSGKNCTWFREYFIDTIYRVEADRVVPEYFIDFQEKGMELSEYLSIPMTTRNGISSRRIPDGTRLNCYKIVETSNLFSFYFWEIPRRYNHFWCIYNKEKDESVYVNISGEFDDIFGTIDPPQVMTSFNEQFCFSVESFKIMERLRSAKEGKDNSSYSFLSELKELSSSLSIDSNPVLVVFSLAKEL